MTWWVLLPITLSTVTFVGSWAVYGLAVFHKHVCPLSNWDYKNSCDSNNSEACCNVPTISTSGRSAPENSLFTAITNAGSFLFLVFAVCHHAHIMERNHGQALLSKVALAFGCVVAGGAFMAGNCNPGYLMTLHYLGAAISFVCLCFYTLLLTLLTSRCTLSGLEFLLYPARIIFTIIQVIATICYCAFFAKDEHFYNHLSAVFEWILSANMELFELSFVVEFYIFSSSMLSVLLEKKDEEKSFILS
ncbi:transmembrane protein 150A [Anguilla rostrata]|uniref:transmembrane protein 150A n=1 Tax=Anguilla rostrata TaxID=7938 RepID=UPI0030D24C7D